jgi:hypothetical protein
VSDTSHIILLKKKPQTNMNHPVQVLPGVGEKRRAALNEVNIFTVGDILESYHAVAEHWKPVAQKYIDSYKELPKLEKAEIKESPREEIANKEIFRYFISDHSWVKQVIQMPIKQEVTNQVYLQEMVIYELSLDPGYNIVMLCEWTQNECENGENIYKVYTRSFSPQMIVFFNKHISSLPVLTLKMRVEDTELLKEQYSNANVLFQVLEETNLMLSVI